MIYCAIELHEDDKMDISATEQTKNLIFDLKERIRNYLLQKQMEV